MDFTEDAKVYLIDVEDNTNYGQAGITIIVMGDQSVKEAFECHLSVI